MNSNTPRTDELESRFDGNIWGKGEPDDFLEAMIEHARELERELNRVKADAEEAAWNEI